MFHDKETQIYEMLCLNLCSPRHLFTHSRLESTYIMGVFNRFFIDDRICLISLTTTCSLSDRAAVRFPHRRPPGHRGPVLHWAQLCSQKGGMRWLASNLRVATKPYKTCPSDSKYMQICYVLLCFNHFSSIYAAWCRMFMAACLQSPCILNLL